MAPAEPVPVAEASSAVPSELDDAVADGTDPSQPESRRVVERAAGRPVEDLLATVTDDLPDGPVERSPGRWRLPPTPGTEPDLSDWVEPEAPPPRRRRRVYAASPPLGLAVGPTSRLAMSFGVRGALLVDLVPLSDSTVFGLDVGGSPAHRMEMEFFRTLWDVHAGASLGWTPDPLVRLDAQVGATFMGFRQQGVPIDELLVPFAGGAMELHTTGRFAGIGLRVRVRSDLMAIKLVNDRGVASNLHPLDLGVDLVVRMSARGDPETTVPTLPRR